jgi:hypothetical protein
MELIWSSYKDKCQALVNNVRNLAFHNMYRISWLAKEVSASQDGWYSMQLMSEWVSEWVSELIT